MLIAYEKIATAAVRPTPAFITLRNSSEPVPMKRTSYAPASHKAASHSTGQRQAQGDVGPVTLLPKRSQSRAARRPRHSPSRLRRPPAGMSWTSWIRVRQPRYRAGHGRRHNQTRAPAPRGRPAADATASTGTTTRIRPGNLLPAEANRLRPVRHPLNRA